MENTRATYLINKSQLSDEDKQYLLNHLKTLSAMTDLFASENEFIIVKKENEQDADYAAAKELLLEEYHYLIDIINDIDLKLSESICKECGKISAEKLRNLANYILEVIKIDERKLTKYLNMLQ